MLSCNGETCSYDCLKGRLAHVYPTVHPPFCSKSIDAAFVSLIPGKVGTRQKASTKLERAYAARARIFCAAIHEDTSILGLVADAMRAGVVINEAGIDFTKAMTGEHPSLAHDDLVFSAVCKALLGVQPEGSSRFAQAVLRLDFPSHSPPARVLSWLAAANASAHTMNMHHQLDRDGYVLVNKWEALNMAAITRVAMGALNSAEQHQVLSNGKLPPVVRAKPDALASLLAPLLESRDLVDVVSAYVGATAAQPACTYGYTALRLNQGITPFNYLSSLWHHDRAGRRYCTPRQFVKSFVLACWWL